MAIMKDDVKFNFSCTAIYVVTEIFFFSANEYLLRTPEDALFCPVCWNLF